MSAPITPALTAEEWARHLGRVYDISGELDTQSRPHALAALCLYGQPYGFTREDVKALRASVDDAERWAANTGYSEPERYRNIDRCRSLADRIEALLPPEAL